MHSSQGIPIGPMIIRSVRDQHGQTLVNIPADMARALRLERGAYAVIQRFTDNTLRVQRFTPEVIPHGP